MVYAGDCRHDLTDKEKSADLSDASNRESGTQETSDDRLSLCHLSSRPMSYCVFRDHGKMQARKFSAGDTVPLIRRAYRI